MKVVFVCTGNTCRSPMAEALMKNKIQQSELDITVDSCGTNVYESEPVNHKAVEALKTIGINCFIHASRQINKSDLETADVVLTMTQQQKYSITKVYGDYKYKVFTINEYARDSKDDVTDPYGKSQIFYNFCVNELNTLIEELFDIFKEQME
jgi:protein-tyrosine phosphatase